MNSVKRVLKWLLGQRESVKGAFRIRRKTRQNELLVEIEFERGGTRPPNVPGGFE
jgi:hypothetical protein